MSLARAALAVCLLLFGACGGGAVASDTATASDGSGSASPDNGLRLAPREDGRVLLLGADRVDSGSWFRLVPARYPDDPDLPAVTIGLGRVEAGDDETQAILWALRQTTDLSALRIEISNERPEFTESKLFMEVDAIRGRDAVLPLGSEHGIEQGDWFFVMNRTDRKPGDIGLGSHIGALLRVTSVAPDAAIARIEHARVAPRPGDPVVFASGSSKSETPVVTVALLRDQKGTGATGESPLLGAVADLVDEFGVSNVSLEFVDAWVDPALDDAPEKANEHAPDGRFGSLVFGRRDPDRYLFNATSFGRTLHPAQTVGILPGGLPIDAPDAATWRHLGGSFLATALATRGDHALAIYLLETMIREPAIHDDVRFHLREHLALRWVAVGRTTEGLRLISEDVSIAERDNLRSPLLNALSIRAAVDREAGFQGQAIADIRRLLEVGHGVLPETALIGERIGLARAYRQAGRHDDAMSELEALREASGTPERQSLRETVIFDLAILLLVRGDAAGALLTLMELEARLPELEPETRAFWHVLVAELYARERDLPRVYANLATCADLIDDAMSGATRSALYQRMGRLLETLGNHDEARQAWVSAIDFALRSLQPGEAADLSMELGLLLLDRAPTADPSAAQEMIAAGRSYLFASGLLLHAAGKSLEAANAFLLVGLIEARAGNAASAERLLERATRWGAHSMSWETVARAYEERAQLANARGDRERARRWRERALMWADAGGVELRVAPLIERTQ